MDVISGWYINPMPIFLDRDVELLRKVIRPTTTLTNEEDVNESQNGVSANKNELMTILLHYTHGMRMRAFAKPFNLSLRYL